MFQPVPIASHPSTVYFWEHSGSFSSTFSHYIAADSNKILLLSFYYLKMNKPWPAGNVLPHADQDAEKANSVLLPQGQLRFMDPQLLFYKDAFQLIGP